LKRLVAMPSSFFLRKRLRAVARVRSIIQPPYFHFRGYQGHFLYGVKEEHGSGVSFGARNYQQNDALMGPCTKCIITHTTFLSKPLFLSNYFLPQPLASDSFPQATTIRSPLLRLKRLPKSYYHNMLLSHL
jgi:hypothetical protein